MEKNKIIKMEKNNTIKLTSKMIKNLQYKMNLLYKMNKVIK